MALCGGGNPRSLMTAIRLRVRRRSSSHDGRPGNPMRCGLLVMAVSSWIMRVGGGRLADASLRTSDGPSTASRLHRAGPSSGCQSKVRWHRPSHEDMSAGWLGRIAARLGDSIRGGLHSRVASREVWSALSIASESECGFVSSFGPTGQLAHTLAVQRAIRRQLIAVVALLLVAGAWRLSPLHEPEPFTLVAMEIGAVILAVELALAWSEREETNEPADELILAGFADTTVCTPIGRAVARRMTRLKSPRSRRRLAEALRWRVRLAEGWTRPSPGLRSGLRVLRPSPAAQRQRVSGRSRRRSPPSPPGSNTPPPIPAR